MRAPRLVPPLVLVAMTILASPGAVLAEDGTPPVGTLEIEGGLGYTRDRSLTLDIPAVDDVGVVAVLVGLAGGEMTELPYAPRVEWSIPGDVGEQELTIEVWWRDAAGNTSTARDTLLYDGTPPSFSTFKETTSEPSPPGSIVFYVGGDDPVSGVRAVRFSTDDGAHWGSEIAMTDQIVIWDPRDPSVGGKPGGLGEVTVKARIRDAAFNWSSARSTTVTYAATLSIGVSSSPTTGKPITFTPQWSDPVTFPAGTHCAWEFMTGNEQALFSGEHDDSYSYHLTQGPASGGWCKPWTFTLPWSPVRLYLVAFRVMLPDGSDVYAELGSPGVRAFTSTVGTTSRAVKTSNLPMFSVLPDDDHLTVGVPTTYRAFAVGGATIRSTDRWSVVQYGPSFSQEGGSTFTFTPQRAGHVTVCLQRRPGDTPMDQLGACFDPMVRRGEGATTSSPDPAAAPSSAATITPAVTTPVGSPVAGQTPTGTAGQVAAAATGSSATEGPAEAPSGAPTSGAAAAGVLVVVLLLGAGLLGGAALAWRPDARAKIRSRLDR